MLFTEIAYVTLNKLSGVIETPCALEYDPVD